MCVFTSLFICFYFRSFVPFLRSSGSSNGKSFYCALVVQNEQHVVHDSVTVTAVTVNWEQAAFTFKEGNNQPIYLANKQAGSQAGNQSRQKALARQENRRFCMAE